MKRRWRKAGKGSRDIKRRKLTVSVLPACTHSVLISHFPAVLPSSETDGLKQGKDYPGRKHCFHSLRSRQIHWHSAWEVV